MLHPQSGVVAQLLGALDLGFRGAALAAVGDELLDLRVLDRQLLGQRMLGRDADEAGAEQGVGTGRVDLQAFGHAVRGFTVKPELEAQPLGAADPVLLHQANLVGPAVQGLQALDQVVGVVGDAQEPLGQLTLLDRRARAPPLAVDDLLISQDGHIDRVPVDRGFLAID